MLRPHAAAWINLLRRRRSVIADLPFRSIQPKRSYGAGQVESEGADRDAKDAYEADGQCPAEHVDGFDHRRAAIGAARQRAILFMVKRGFRDCGVIGSPQPDGALAASRAPHPYR